MVLGISAQYDTMCSLRSPAFFRKEGISWVKIRKEESIGLWICY